MVRHGTELFALAPNMAIKVPAVAAGVRAIEELTASGVVINATVLFTLPQALAVAEAVERGSSAPHTPGSTSSASPLRDDHGGRSMTTCATWPRSSNSPSIRSTCARPRPPSCARPTHLPGAGYRSTLLSARCAATTTGPSSSAASSCDDPTQLAGEVQRLRGRGEIAHRRSVDETIVEELLATFPDFGRAYARRDAARGVRLLRRHGQDAAPVPRRYDRCSASCARSCYRVVRRHTTGRAPRRSADDTGAWRPSPRGAAERGAERPDVLLVSGDAYVDHPSFAPPSWRGCSSRSASPWPWRPSPRGRTRRRSRRSAGRACSSRHGRQHGLDGQSPDGASQAAPRRRLLSGRASRPAAQRATSCTRSSRAAPSPTR